MILELNANIQKGAFKLKMQERFSLQGVNCVYGHNGAGKSTLMRLIAGLDFYPDVYLNVGNEVWQGPGIFVPVQQRQIAMIFQDHNLFPHLSVQQNIDYALKRSNTQADAAYQKWLYQELDLKRFLKCSVSQLSAGQAQLIALARTFLLRPKILILDEAFVAIDSNIQEKIVFLLKHFVNQYAIPVFLVTHQQPLIQDLADQIIVLSQGELLAHCRLSGESMIDFKALNVAPFNRIEKKKLHPYLIQAFSDIVPESTHQALDVFRVAADAIVISKQVLNNTTLPYQVSAKIEKMIDFSAQQVAVYSKYGDQYLFSLHSKYHFEALALKPGDPCYLLFS